MPERLCIQPFEDLLASRHHVSPARLESPAPDGLQLDRIFWAAATAPDHGRLTPWRFVVIPAEKRTLLAESFALALTDRDPSASAAQIEMAREKAGRAPLLILCIGKLGVDQSPASPLERMISLGAAVQNMLLAAKAMGFDSGISSGKAMASRQMRELFELHEGEEAVCFLSFGTATKRKPPRTRPNPSTFVSTL